MGIDKGITSRIWAFSVELNDVRMRIDQYVDLILATLRHGLENTGFSQVQLPNATSAFSETILGIKWNGEASAWNGWLKGVQSIHRTGPASININVSVFLDKNE